MFKCIGCTKEHRYQETLCRAAQYMAKDEDVACILEAEPSNPVDAKAIAFKCEVDGSWKTIGYAVSEVLDDLHAALEQKVIINVKFEWIKLIFHWRVPGWYAGISITRNGEWSSVVCLAQSATR